MEELEQALLRLIGYGNPADAKYFFFAREENSDLIKDKDDDLEKERIKYYKECNKNKLNDFYAINCSHMYSVLPPDIKYKDIKKGKGSKLYQCYYNIYKLISGSEIEFDNFINILGSEQLNALFFGNLDFTPRPMSNHRYKKDTLIEKFANDNCQRRDDILELFFQKYVFENPEKIVICFGFPPHGKFLDNLGEEKNDKWEVLKTTIIKTDKEITLKRNKTYKNIFWTYHPAYGWLPEAQQKDFANIIKMKM
jgi:hypothetical protein